MFSAGKFVNFYADMQRIYFTLMRLALDGSKGPASCASLPRSLSAEEWKRVYDLSVKQCLVGLLYGAVQKLPAEQRPPRELLLKWAFGANQLSKVNSRMNSTAARLTEMFAARGLHPVILKGQANARLYPEPLLRQAGDIDILIEGGRDGVVQTLTDMGMTVESDDDVSDHHVHLDKKLFGGITIEVHFQPTSCFSPSKTRNMLQFLDHELAQEQGRTLVAEGFYVPSIPFALVMQLSHLRQHFFSTGIGLRQLADYHQLLQASTAEERALVAKGLKSFGLYRMAAATMWLMEQVFALPGDRMLCAPDKRRGKWLLDVVMNGGNFGRYASNYNVPVLTRWLIDRKRALRLMSFDFTESLWRELRYWKLTLSLIPRRLKRGRIALGNR